jgi:hypothetical protein
MGALALQNALRLKGKGLGSRPKPIQLDKEMLSCLL